MEKLDKVVVCIMVLGNLNKGRAPVLATNLRRFLKPVTYNKMWCRFSFSYERLLCDHVIYVMLLCETKYLIRCQITWVNLCWMLLGDNTLYIKGAAFWNLGAYAPGFKIVFQAYLRCLKIWTKNFAHMSRHPMGPRSHFIENRQFCVVCKKDKIWCKKGY